MKVALVANTAWYIANFRAGLIKRLKAEGYDVVAIAPRDEAARRLTAMGVPLTPVPISREGLNPVSEFGSVLALRRAFARERPDVVMSYTPKGTIYSAIAMAGRPERLVVNISGLGRAFAPGSKLAGVSRTLYRYALRRASRVFFENLDDHRRFLELGIVGAGRSERIPGLGVDLEHFRPGVTQPDRPAGGELRFLLAGRLLWDKGIAEYVEAARHVRARHGFARFDILGFIEPAGPAAVPRSTLDGWVAEGVVAYRGVTDDVRPAMLGADCVVLPSYYPEGVPRSLLEAAALGRPIVTTNSVGCRDAVDDGVTGYLALPRDASDLADKLVRLAALPEVERNAMGQAARLKMEREFDESRVLDRVIVAIERAAGEAAR